MDYEQLVKLALKGRSVNQAAKDWGVQQTTLNRYITGKRLPDYETAMKMAEEAGVDPGKVFRLLAELEHERKKSPVVATIAAAALVTMFLTDAQAPSHADDNLTIIQIMRLYGRAGYARSSCHPGFSHTRLPSGFHLAAL